MVKVRGTFEEGALYQYNWTGTLGSASGWYNHRFETSDGKVVVRIPPYGEE